MKFGKKLKIGLKLMLVGFIVAIVAWLLEMLYLAVVALTDNFYVIIIGGIAMLILIVYAYGHFGQKILKIR